MGVPNSNPTSLSVVTTEFGGGGSMRAAAAAAGLSTPDGLAEFKGMSAAWSTTMTIGSQTAKPGTRYGYIPGVSVGSLGDTTVDTLSGTQINGLHTNFSGVGVLLTWNGSLQTGWTSITIGSNTINRSSFSTYSTVHSLTSGNYIATSGTQTITFNI
jgi:hypothetical protein